MYSHFVIFTHITAIASHSSSIAEQPFNSTASPEGVSVHSYISTVTEKENSEEELKNGSKPLLRHRVRTSNCIQPSVKNYRRKHTHFPPKQGAKNHHHSTVNQFISNPTKPSAPTTTHLTTLLTQDFSQWCPHQLHSLPSPRHKELALQRKAPATSPQQNRGSLGLGGYRERGSSFGTDHGKWRE